MTNVCVGIFGYVFGHKYRARYDEQEEFPPLKTFEGNISVTMMNAMKEKDKTYRGDVCARCGKVVNTNNE